MKNIVIIGSGGLGREVYELILDINRISPQWHVLGFYDDYEANATIKNGLPIIGTIADLKLSPSLNVVIAIGDSLSRKKIYDELNGKFLFPTLVHPDIRYRRGLVSIGEATIIMKDVFISINTSIGCGVLLNVACTIGHDTIIGDFTSIGPGSRISGNVRIGEFVSIGVGAIISDKIHVERNTKIGPGSVIVKSIIKSGTYFGVPARLVIP